uniref:Uncharacterized protein n=1 Tax=Steinernema glaseri TaxID=37863 RepID=A0A1I7Y4I9_9BILA
MRLCVGDGSLESLDTNINENWSQGRTSQEAEVKRARLVVSTLFAILRGSPNQMSLVSKRKLDLVKWLRRQRAPGSFKEANVINAVDRA